MLQGIVTVAGNQWSGALHLDVCEIMNNSFVASWGDRMRPCDKL